jgi:hypothetical protein
MYHSDDFLERIRQTEINNLNKFSPLKLFSALTIEKTKELVGAKHIKEDLEEKCFTPDFLTKYVILIFSVLLLLKAIKDTFFESNVDTALIVLTYFLSVILIYSAIKQFFFNKSLKYEIIIDRTKIKIKNQTFLWEDIYETAILTKGGWKNKTEYFIIAMKDMNTYEKFELSNFKGFNSLNFSARLSKYIEHFKSAAVQ